MDELETRIKDTQARILQAVAASNFGTTNEGELLLNYINDRVSSLLNKLIAVDPVTDREYLSIHGGIRELQSINVMLQTKAAQLEPAKEELDALRQDADS